VNFEEDNYGLMFVGSRVHTAACDCLYIHSLNAMALHHPSSQLQFALLLLWLTS
jgi:hypothetical protein